MPDSQSATWPDDLLTVTKSLYEAGKHTSAQIAVIVGHGKSRNAIIGKAHREGWKNPNPQKGGTKPGDKRPRQIRIGGPNWVRRVESIAIEQPAEIPKPENFLNLTIQELKPDQCRYPDGDGAYFFCGNPTQDGSSYCAFHHRVCWQKPDRQPDRQFVTRQKF